MSQVNKIEKGLGEQIQDLLEMDSENYDVIFSVGENKVEVKAVKIVLKAASPVFKERFDNEWKDAVTKDGEGIPLRNLDPDSFKLFIKLLIRDKWSVESLKEENLSSDQVLSLLGICRQFKIAKAYKSLEAAANKFIRTFHQYKDTQEFLGMTRANLETVLSCEEVQMNEPDIFESACRWAEHQCKQKGTEPTGENMRKELGACLNEIRFPTLTVTEFTERCRHKKVLNDSEILDIYSYIGIQDKNREDIDTTKLCFKTQRRQSKIFDLTKVYAGVGRGEYACNGSNHGTHFESSKPIALEGIGFFGPVGNDSDYDVSVQIKTQKAGSWNYDSGNIVQKLQGKKDKIIYFFFDEPIKIEPRDSNAYNNTCYIYYSLKGPNVSMLKDNVAEKLHSFGGSEYRLHQNFPNSPIAELIIKHL